MKIVITSEGKELNSKLDGRFGRCGFFIVYDTETKKIEAKENAFKSGGGGAGIKAGGFAAENGEALIGANIGPNAFETLNAAGLKVYEGSAGKSVEENIDAYLKGELKILEKSNAADHNGMQ